MLAKERQNKIYKMIQENGAITTSNLIKIFDVSIETIRRDLLYMEQGKLLKRVHGGAVAFGEMKPFFDLNQRNQENNKQKQELAIKASEFVCEGDFIAVDAGSTGIYFAEILKEKFSCLTVVTHSVDVFEILRECKNFNVILCGGYYMKTEKAFYGALTIDTLDKLHIQKAFIFPSAVSLKFGICDYQQDLYQIQKKILECSDDIYILADSSKFEKKALLKLDDMKSEYYYVTDSLLSDELKNIYKENDINIFNGGKKK